MVDVVVYPNTHPQGLKKGLRWCLDARSLSECLPVGTSPLEAAKTYHDVFPSRAKAAAKAARIIAKGRV